MISARMDAYFVRRRRADACLQTIKLIKDYN